MRIISFPETSRQRHIGGISGTEAAPVYQYGPARSAQNGGVIETRVFNIPKNYLFPIPDSDVKMAPNLKQNPGWEITGE